MWYRPVKMEEGESHVKDEKAHDGISVIFRKVRP